MYNLAGRRFSVLWWLQCSILNVHNRRGSAGTLSPLDYSSGKIIFGSWICFKVPVSTQSLTIMYFFLEAMSTMWILRNFIQNILIIVEVKPGEVDYIWSNSTARNTFLGQFFCFIFCPAELCQTSTFVRLIQHRLSIHISVHLKGEFDVMADVWTKW